MIFPEKFRKPFCGDHRTVCGIIISVDHHRDAQTMNRNKLIIHSEWIFRNSGQRNPDTKIMLKCNPDRYIFSFIPADAGIQEQGNNFLVLPVSRFINFSDGLQFPGRVEIFVEERIDL